MSRRRRRPHKDENMRDARGDPGLGALRRRHGRTDAAYGYTVKCAAGAGALQNRYLIPAATTFDPFGASAPKKPDRWWIRPTTAHSGYLGSAMVTSNNR